MSQKPAVKEVVAPRMDGSPGQLKPIGGSNCDDFNNVLTNSVMQCLWLGSDGNQNMEPQLQAALAAMMGLKPQNEQEGMLIAQMIACHHAAMECYRRAMLPSQSFEGRNLSLNYANKLSRTYASLVDTLDKHRGKGQQKVTVEHVHVHQGGQAIVGNVQTGAGGVAKRLDQAHA